MVDKLFTVPIEAWERWWGDVTPLIGPVLQWLKGLRNRGLPHLPQLHQLSLGLNRSRIHLRPGQQPIPGGFAQLLLAASRIHAPHMTAVRIQPVAVG